MKKKNEDELGRSTQFWALLERLELLDLIISSERFIHELDFEGR
jgi:hypothetical protein